MTEMLTLRRAALLLALLPLSWSSLSFAQAPEAPLNPGDVAPAESTGGLSVHLQLSQTSLSRKAILRALEEEFQVRVLETESTNGLVISVDARQLQASYRENDGKIVAREMALPEAESHQLDTIALLAGNLARDEGGELLAQLQAAQAAQAAQTAETSNDLKDEDTSLADAALDAPEPSPEVAKVSPTVAPAAKTESPAAPPAPVVAPVPLRELDDVPVSISIAGSLAFPPMLRERRTHFEVGLIHSNLGAVDGFAASLFALRNQGLDTKNGNKGVVLAGLWLRSSGYFKGMSFAGLVDHMAGGMQGAQGAGLVAIQTGNMKGFQAALLVSVVGERIKGVQLAGIAVHSSGGVSGQQLALISSSAGGTVDGNQFSVVNVAPDVKGHQFGIANIAYRGFTGLQLGITNVAGDFKGTQIGLLNVGGRGRGTQLALLNVARDLEGTSIAPLSIIPGTRNQLLSYVTYSPDPPLEGLPAGPMTHLALRVVPGLIYTQTSFGLGAEAKECASPNDSSSCVGGATEYAVGLAVGIRPKLVGKLHAEIDLQYQFEKAFSTSSNSRHSILGRAALAYQFVNSFAIFAGAGPRLNMKSGPAATPDPEVSWAPHFFGGIQFF